MEYFFIVSAWLLLVIGFLGALLPLIPGPPLSFLALVLLYFTERYDLSESTLWIMGIIMLLLTILDYTLPIQISRKMNGSRWGTYGCALGLLVGLFFGPIGFIFGPVIGALIGELMSGKNLEQAWPSALGAFLGFLTGTMLKLGYALAAITLAILAIW
ncbi:DUF456 domain-containing protein [Penaeicola halotolerans]|uniref:DUF456 domain-containing protein n=1 Tax=Penaeicola halotolerans TaxID=2793196 RepID=UPI001CF89534|nr:DUF456 domain-containing protein [Penaeicola halotolerans]